MSLEYLRMLINAYLNKDTYVVPEEAPLIILDSKYNICMANNGKDNKHTRQLSRRVHYVRDGDNWKMHKIHCCEGGLQLVYIANNNVGDNDLNPRTRYIVVRIDNWDRTLVK